jgi:hypothetical protein
MAGASASVFSSAARVIVHNINTLDVWLDSINGLAQGVLHSLVMSFICMVLRTSFAQIFS